jgi:predicted amino acid racemase
LNGIKPDTEKMKLLSSLAYTIEAKFGIHIPMISGGNSGNYQWFSHVSDVGRINHLRIGESLFLGRETLKRLPIPDLFLDAFTLVAEITEIKIKPSLPYGTTGQNALGKTPEFKDTGTGTRAILGMGEQDVPLDGLIPELNVKILGGGSDHIIINPQKNKFKVGTEVRFNLNYSALLSAMTSPYISKVNILN